MDENTSARADSRGELDTHALFQHLARLVVEPWLGVSRDGVVLLICPRARELLAPAEQEVVGQRLQNLTANSPQSLGEYVQLCSRSLTPLPGSLIIKDMEGKEVPYRCEGAVMLPPPSECIVVLRIMPKLRSQLPFLLLRQKIEDLTHEVMNRKRAEREALRALQLRDDFLAVASHEFKTPLQSLKLQLELVVRAVRNTEKQTAERLAPRIELMDKQIDRLAVLSSGLLDLSAIRAGSVQLHLQPYDLTRLCRAAVDRVSSDLTRAGCEVILDLQQEVYALVDASRLAQILGHLLSNVTKYGPGKPVELSVQGNGDVATIAVADHGMGIEEKDVERIFQKFERAVSSEHYGGLGLGLFISRALAEGMGGRLSVQSTPTKGTRFMLELKEAKPPAVVAQ